MGILDVLAPHDRTILDILKDDHDRLQEMLEEVLSAKDGKRRGQLFKAFKAELVAHSRAEEKALYSRMEKSSEGRPEALEGFVEHEVADRLCDDLSQARNTAAEPWTARCKVLKELLDHHIEEEEGELFKTARKLFDKKTLAKMGAEFTNEKAKHLGQPSVAGGRAKIARRAAA
jgi:hemerythrin-like domain-containing protein